MYIEHFRLTGPPFRLTPDARFWFDSRSHRKALAYLGFGLAQGEGFIAVTGETGAGKSTLIQHLLSRIDPKRLHAISLVAVQSQDEFLAQFSRELGLASEAVREARWLEGVEDRLEQLFRAGRQTLLAVDEAQNLTIPALEALRRLSQFQVEGKAPIQFFLLGQPELGARLASPELAPLNQRVLASHQLDPLGADEVEAYIRHRLGLVGWQSRPGFAAGAFAAIHRATGGLPLRLNQLATGLLMHAAVEGLETIGVDNVAEASLPPREARSEPSLAAPEPVPAPTAATPVIQAEAPPPGIDPALERQIATLERQMASLETRAQAQEAALRRVLTLLVDWAERNAPATNVRAA